MNLRALGLLIVAAATTADVRYFQYERPILNTPPKQLQTCVALDAGIFAHAAPLLSDLRLYHADKETPYAIWFAAPIEQGAKSIGLLNLGERGGSVIFDAAMPEGRYADIDLNIATENFIASVDVSGSQTQDGHETKIGSYTVFDLSKQKLGRSSVLRLPESDFRFLHFRIGAPVKTQDVNGLTIGRLPQNQPRYGTVAESAGVTQKGGSSVLEFTVPGNVPVDRIAFIPGAEPVNFSRDVTVTITPVGDSESREATEPAEPSTSTGNILRVHVTRSGRRVDEEHLAVNGYWSLFQRPARWTVAIDNGNDAPIDLKSVRLEMLERSLCFDATPGGDYRLYYGDPVLPAPRYDYSLLFSREPDAAQASLGAERKSPEYQPRPDERPFTEKHPALLWIALVLVILLLGGIALRSARQVPAQ